MENKCWNITPTHNQTNKKPHTLKCKQILVYLIINFTESCVIFFFPIIYLHILCGKHFACSFKFICKYVSYRTLKEFSPGEFHDLWTLTGWFTLKARQCSITFSWGHALSLGLGEKDCIPHHSALLPPL